MATLQPPLPSILHSYLANCWPLAVPSGEVDCPGVLSTLRQMDPGQRSLHSLEAGSGLFGQGIPGSRAPGVRSRSGNALDRHVPLALKIL